MRYIRKYGDFAQNSSKAEVSMTMNPEGAETWRKLTKDCFNRPRISGGI